MEAVQAAEIWVEFHTPDADRVASFYLETTRPRPVIQGIPLPTEYRLLECSHSDNPASLNLKITNGGSPIDGEALEAIRRHIQDYYLEAGPRESAPLMIRDEKVIPVIERRVTIGFVHAS